MPSEKNAAQQNRQSASILRRRRLGPGRHGRFGYGSFRLCNRGSVQCIRNRQRASSRSVSMHRFALFCPACADPWLNRSFGVCHRCSLAGVWGVRASLDFPGRCNRLCGVGNFSCWVVPAQQKLCTGRLTSRSRRKSSVHCSHLHRYAERSCARRTSTWPHACVSGKSALRCSLTPAFAVAHMR